MKVTRRRRDQRLDKPRRMRLQERDIDIVEAVHRHRVLRQGQIQRLFFGPRNKSGTQRRLELLYDHRYLERVFLPMLPGEGGSPTLYVLDKAGADLLRLTRGYDEIPWQGGSKAVKADFLAHTVATNEFMVSMSVACQAQGVELESWQTERELKRDYDYVSVTTPTGRRQRLAVVPDSYFTLVADGRRYPFFLEMDMGTMTLARYKSKVQAYMVYRRRGYEARFGRTSLRVLSVTPGQRRLENLKRAAEEVRAPDWFWFGLLSDVGAARILSETVWQVAGRVEPTRLLDLS